MIKGMMNSNLCLALEYRVGLIDEPVGFGVKIPESVNKLKTFWKQRP